MKKLSKQKQWIVDYIKAYGSVTPALMGGRVWNGSIWPSQGDKRCRELRKAGILTSYFNGKYEVFKYNFALPGDKIETVYVEKIERGTYNDALFQSDNFMYRV